MRIIKRYNNRRFYDTKQKKTIHLEDIAAFLQSGEEIQIIDHNSNLDITAKVIAKTFFKLATQNKNQEFVVFLFSSLIREFQTNLPKFLFRLMQGGIGTEYLTLEKLIKIIQVFIDIGELNIKEHKEYLEQIVSKININKKDLEKKLLEQILNDKDTIKHLKSITEDKLENEKEYIYLFKKNN